MLNNQRGNIAIIAFIFISLLIAGVYYLNTQKTKVPTKTETTLTKPSSTPSLELTKKVTKVAPLGSFQRLLLTECQTVTRSDGVDSPHMDLNKAPFLINQDIIKIKFNLPNKLTCEDISITEKSAGFIPITLQNNWNINIYDKDSKEGGHGGPPYLGSYGAVIKDDGNIKYTVYLPITEIGITSETGLIMRGEKKLKLSSGEAFFANYATTAMDGKDSRVINYVSNLKNSSEENTDAEINEDIKNKFFSNLANLQPSEKKAMDEIKKVLGAISIK